MFSTCTADICVDQCFSRHEKYYEHMHAFLFFGMDDVEDMK